MVRDDYYREDRRDRGDSLDDRRDTGRGDRRERGRDMDDYDPRDERRDIDRRDRDDYDRPQRQNRDHPPSRDRRGQRPPPSRPVGGKPWLLPMVFAIIALVFIGLSLAGPWNTTRVEGKALDGDDGWVEYDYKLQSVQGHSSEKTFNDGKDKDSDVYSYNEKPDEDNPMGMEGDIDKGGSPATLLAWNVSFYLTVIALITAILFLVFIIIGGIKRNQGFYKGAMVFGIITIILGFLAPIYAATGIPAGVEADFDESMKDWDESIMGDKPKLEHNSWWDSWSDGEGDAKYDYSRGAGWGWYLSLIGGIMALLAVIFVIIMNKKHRAGMPPRGYGTPYREPPRDRDYDDYDQPPRRERDREPPQYRDDYDDRDRPQRHDRERAPPPDEYDDDRNDRNRPRRQERPKDRGKSRNRDGDYYDEQPPTRPPY